MGMKKSHSWSSFDSFALHQGGTSSRPQMVIRPAATAAAPMQQRPFDPLSNSTTTSHLVAAMSCSPQLSARAASFTPFTPSPPPHTAVVDPFAVAQAVLPTRELGSPNGDDEYDDMLLPDFLRGDRAQSL
jgi:hypothetical protein